MTYSDNTGQMRESMATLLSWQRVQQRLGGGGNPTLPATTTAAERERMGQIIQRYRLSALTWCLQPSPPPHRTPTVPEADGGQSRS